MNQHGPRGGPLETMKNVLQATRIGLWGGQSCPTKEIVFRGLNVAASTGLCLAGVRLGYAVTVWLRRR